MKFGHFFRSIALAVAALPLALGGCASQPITMPEDLSEAAKFCYFASYLNSQRTDLRDTDDLPPLKVHTSWQAYLMIAASTDAKFDDHALDRQVEGLSDYATESGPYIKSLTDAELKREVSECENRFEISGDLAIWRSQLFLSNTAKQFIIA